MVHDFYKCQEITYRWVSARLQQVIYLSIYPSIHPSIYIYIYLLLVIPMPWRGQATFASKRDKLSSSAECRIRSQGLADWMSADKPTEECQGSSINLNSTARPYHAYDQRAFSPLDPTKYSQISNSLQMQSDCGWIIARILAITIEVHSKYIPLQYWCALVGFWRQRKPRIDHPLTDTHFLKCGVEFTILNPTVRNGNQGFSSRLLDRGASVVVVQVNAQVW